MTLDRQVVARAALLKIRCASRVRQGHQSIAYARANGMVDHADERTAARVVTDVEVIAGLLEDGFAERTPEGIVITERGIEHLEKTVHLQPRVAVLSRAQKAQGSAKASESPRWECQGCGAVNVERSGACVGCKLRGPIRRELS